MKKHLPLIMRLISTAGFIYSVFLMLHGNHNGYLLALTFGATSAPSNITEYFDSLISLSLPNCRKTITDNISATNAFLFKMMNSEFYESADGGSWIEEPLMYALGSADSYAGYDELGSQTTDGITKALYEWRSIAAPISYSGDDLRKNRHGLESFATAKLTQARLGLEETFAQHFMYGAGNGALGTARQSVANSSYSVDPIAKLIAYDPTASASIGNIAQNTYSWWRNKTGFSAATTYEAFLLEFDHAYNTAALGSGGPPDIILVDQITYELIVHAYFQKFRSGLTDGPPDFPFECKKFKKALLVMDDKVPDVYTNVTSAATYGAAFFLNTQFFRMRYDPQENFEFLKDENGKTMAKPINGNSRLGHISWAGNTTCNNRRKQAVFGKIPRTLT